MEPYVADPEIGYIALRHRATGLVVVLTAPDGALSGTLAVGQAEGAGKANAGTLHHLAFAVPDGEALTAWADHLSSVGINHDGVVLENGNPSRQRRDPDGTAIEVVAPAS